MGLREKGQVMMFWFNIYYSEQRNDYNAVLRSILACGFLLLNSSSAHSAHSTRSPHSTRSARSTRSTRSAHSAHSAHSTRSARSTRSAHSAHSAFSRSSEQVSRNPRGQGHAAFSQKLST